MAQAVLQNRALQLMALVRRYPPGEPHKQQATVDGAAVTRGFTSVASRVGTAAPIRKDVTGAHTMGTARLILGRDQYGLAVPICLTRARVLVG